MKNFLAKIILWFVIILSTFFVFRDVHSPPVSIPNEYHYRIFTSELKCLTDNIWHEARNQGTKGMYVVAEVTRNRVYSGKFGDSYCKVVYQPWQFSWVKQKQKVRKNKQEAKKLHEAKLIAYRVMHPDYVPKLPPSVTYYHTKEVNPSWSRVFKKYATIGSHILYKKG